MTDPDRTFTDPMAELYDSLLGSALFGPYAEVVSAAVKRGNPATVLETAAGTGILTRQLSADLPDASIIATDVNEPMIVHAQSALSLPNVTWETVDAQSLPYPDQSFDCVVCQFGAMFFPDRVMAYAEAKRVLRPGGRLVLAIWDAIELNHFTRITLDAVRPLLPEGPTFTDRVPHGYYDVDVIRSDLEASGFVDVSFESVVRYGHANRGADVARGVIAGTPLMANKPELWDEAIERAASALDQALTSADGSGLTAVNTAHLVVAQRS